jgi:hypothetical protein
MLLDLWFCMCVLWIVVCPFVLFLLAIVHVLSVDIRILITPLVTSNSSFQEEQYVGGWMGVKTLVKVVAFPWLIRHCTSYLDYLDFYFTKYWPSQVEDIVE